MDPYEPLPQPRGSSLRDPYYYIVTGVGVFPEDMLRYDKSWAITGLDTPKPQTLYNGGGLFQMDASRSVVLATWDRLSPSSRWASFGWAVKDRRITKPNFLP